MSDILLKTQTDDTTALAADDIEALRASLRGTVCLPGEDAYDEARAIWNAMIDRRPGLIVRCAGAADVMQAVKLAAERGLVLAVHGAGHNIAGKSIHDGALLIDLSQMKDVKATPTRASQSRAPAPRWALATRIRRG